MVECTLVVAGLEVAADCRVGIAALNQQDACKELVCAGVVVDAVRVVHLVETLECLK